MQDRRRSRSAEVPSRLRSRGRQHAQPWGHAAAPPFSHSDSRACCGDSGLELIWKFGADRLPEPQGDAALPDVALPQRPAKAVRVVSWNVLRGSPMKSPGPFSRVLRALQPDVVLVQEWDDVDGGVLVEWFEENIGPRPPWHAVTGPHGVAVVSRLPLAALDLGDLVLPHGAPGGGEPVQFAAAVVATRLGDVLVASAHLTCCGSAGDERDRRRVAEVSVVRHALLGLPVEQRRFLAVGGDINLVGSRIPLDRLDDNLDADGTDLTPAPTRVLGDRAFYTWTDADSEFSPGRLDWLLYSDATLRGANSFAVDPARLSDRSLERAGLQPPDSRASDHLPIVVDLVGSR